MPRFAIITVHYNSQPPEKKTILVRTFIITNNISWKILTIKLCYHTEQTKEECFLVRIGNLKRYFEVLQGNTNPNQQDERSSQGQGSAHLSS